MKQIFYMLTVIGFTSFGTAKIHSVRSNTDTFKFYVAHCCVVAKMKEVTTVIHITLAVRADTRALANYYFRTAIATAARELKGSVDESSYTCRPITEDNTLTKLNYNKPKILSE